MVYLSLDDVTDLAPAAATPKTTADVIDTSAFIRHARTLGFRPVMALQPTTHEDAQYAKRRDGRHLVVVANLDNCLCLVLVNSHTVDLKPRIGLANWDAANGFLIGPAFSLKRRNGFKGPVAVLMAQRPSFLAVRGRLVEWSPQERTLLRVATDIVDGVYARRTNRPAAAALIPKDYDGMLHACSQMFAAMRKGGLPPRGHNRRRVKGIISPDSLFEASQIVMASAMMRSARTMSFVSQAAGDDASLA